MSRRFIVALALLGVLSVVCWIPGTDSGAEQGTSKLAEKILGLGTVGPGPINLSVWTNKPDDQKFKAGERVVIYFKADKNCYVTALNVSRQGDVAVLFPSKERPDNFIKGGQEYSLFGDDSRVRLEMEKGLPEVKAVFYATPEPILLEPGAIPNGRPILQIPHTAKETLDTLVAKLEKASASPGFNRVVLAIKSETAEGPHFKLMGPTPKDIPIERQSETPESLTGAQGVKSVVK